MKSQFIKYPANAILIFFLCMSVQLTFSQQLESELDIFQNEPFKVSPNPTSGEVFISGMMEKVEIYDVLGKKVFETNKSNFDISELDAGVYLIKVTHNNKGTVKRLIKN